MRNIKTDLQLKELTYEVNRQVLSFVCETCAVDQAAAGLVFGLPLKLVRQLAGLNTSQIEMLSATQVCLLTLRNCGDENFWDRLIQSCSVNSDVHKLNLIALSLIQANRNTLPTESGLGQDAGQRMQ